MARVIVTAAQGTVLGRADAPLIRETLAAIWHPDLVLDMADTPGGAEELAAECWTQWGGQVLRRPQPSLALPHAAEAMRAAEMLSGEDLIGVLVFSADGATNLTATLADLTGVPVRVVSQ